jgi:hypothetical protein
MRSRAAASAGGLTRSCYIHNFLRSVTFINVALLLFNLLPIYPLDGGQIFGALLWFVVGRARSMVVAAVVGLVGVVGLGWLAISWSSLGLGFIALLAAAQCLSSIYSARLLNRMARGPRRTGVACPSCRTMAPIGPYWRCDSCSAAFDIFDPAAGASGGSTEPAGFTTLRLSAGSTAAAPAEGAESHCPACHTNAATARCWQCHAIAPVADWNQAAVTSASPSGVEGVTNVRPPRIPSLAPIILGVCAGIVALMMIFVATLMYIGSLAEADAALALFGRYAALVVSALALLPAVASILFFVRYRRTRRAFNLEWQRFVDERHQPALSNGSLQQ